MMVVMVAVVVMVLVMLRTFDSGVAAVREYRYIHDTELNKDIINLKKHYKCNCYTS